MKPYLFFFAKLSIDPVFFSQRRLISTDLETISDQETSRISDSYSQAIAAPQT
jgi:hypothetical protein